MAPSQKTSAVSRSKRAGLQFSVGGIHRSLRQGGYADRVGDEAPVYLAAVLEYLTSEVIELSGNAAHDNKKTLISSRNVKQAVRNYEELNKLLGNVKMLPNIHPTPVPNPQEKNSNPSQEI